MILFCPYDSTILTIARSNPSDEFPKGQNAYTCRSCPYVSPLTHRMYDRNYMKRKEVEDVLGGEDGGGWGNVDQADGESRPKENRDYTSTWMKNPGRASLKHLLGLEMVDRPDWWCVYYMREEMEGELRNITREISSGNQVVWDPYFQNLAGPWNHIPYKNNAASQAESNSGSSEVSVNNADAGVEARGGNAGGNNQAPANIFAAPVTAGVNPLPTCGEPCYGPINSCDPLTGCSCIADPLDSPLNAMYTGQCGVVYTSAATRRRRLNSLDFLARSENNASSSAAEGGAPANMPLTQIEAIPQLCTVWQDLRAEVRDSD
ncbi:vacuolar calcium ion transporter [Physcia stellaris]|nr:vacuolar calcium ion transporter [Physcia stellaris]